QMLGGLETGAQAIVTPLLRILFTLLPGWPAYASLMFAQRALAAIFTYRLLRDRFECSRAAAIFAAMFYSLFHQPELNGAASGFTIYDGFWLPGIPALLWLAAQLPRKLTLGSIACAALLGVIWGASSVPPLAILALPLLLFWFVLIDRRREWSFWAAGAVFVAAWALVSLPTMLAVMRALPLSHRAAWNAADSAFGSPIERLIYPFLIWRENALAGILVFAALLQSRTPRIRWLALA